jgi:hypothetical protein
LRTLRLSGFASIEHLHRDERRADRSLTNPSAVRVNPACRQDGVSRAHAREAQARSANVRRRPPHCRRETATDEPLDWKAQRYKFHARCYAGLTRAKRVPDQAALLKNVLSARLRRMNSMLR